MDTPGIIRVSDNKKFTLEAARELGIEKWIEKMLHFSDQLRRLKIDCFEYVSMKVIVLLTSGKSIEPHILMQYYCNIVCNLIFLAFFRCISAQGT